MTQLYYPNKTSPYNVEEKLHSTKDAMFKPKTRNKVSVLMVTFSIISLFLCTSCSTFRSMEKSIMSVEAPTPPKAQAVLDKHMEIAKIFDPNFSNTNITPQEYAKAGYRVVDEKCDNFFIQLTQARRGLDYTKTQTGITLSAVAAALALAGSTAKELAIMAIGGTVFTTSLDNTADLITLTKFPDQLQRIVKEQRGLYKRLNDPDLLESADTVRAVDFVEGYASICTIDNLESIIAQSLAGSKGKSADEPIVGVTIGISILQQLVKADLKLNKEPTTGELQELYGLLSSHASDDRKNATAPFDRADDVYWQKSDGTLRQKGQKMMEIIKMLFPEAEKPPEVAPAAGSGDKISTNVPQPKPPEQRTLSNKSIYGRGSSTPLSVGPITGPK